MPDSVKLTVQDYISGGAPRGLMVVMADEVVAAVDGGLRRYQF
jgi:hypothetical protein